MPKTKKTFFIIFAISTALALSFSAASADEIEIKPVLEGKDYCIMKLGEIQTFRAYGFGWDKGKQEKIPGIEIKAVHWTFDSRFLELKEEKEDTITLKAIKPRTSKLTVTGTIENESVIKTIFIVIK